MIAAILQARMSSSRLPGKVLMKVDDSKTVIKYVVEQLKHSKRIDKIIVATSDKPEDDRIFDTVTECGTECFRGSLDDVLDRYYQCAKKFSVDTIVRITCDNPLIDPKIADDILDEFSSKYDVATNIFPRSYPYGTEVEVFSFSALQTAWRKAKLPSEREHVTPYFYKNPEKFRIKNIQYHKDISKLRWTVDRKEDLELVRYFASKIKKRPILLQDILDVISKDHTILEINKNYDSKEGYLKSLKEDEEYLKRHG